MTINFQMYRTNGNLLGGSALGDQGEVVFGDAALQLTLTSLEDGATGTITTNGANPFGATGPEFVVMLDPWAVDVGDYLHGDIQKGAGVTFTSGADNEKVFDVEAVGRLGKGFPMGSTGTGINPTDTQRLRCSHPDSSKQFESCMSYWPEANQQNTIPTLADNVNNQVTWQMKPIWNMHRSDTFNDNGTNYFIRRAIGTGFYNPVDPGYFLDTPQFSTNMIGQSFFFGGSINSSDPAKDYNLPYDEIYTTEAFYDQGSQTNTPDGEVQIYESREGSPLTKATESNKVIVDLTDGDVVNGTNIGHFTYPGFMRGWVRANNQHFYDAELYKTQGDGAACRVALCDHADYFQSTLRAFQVVNLSDWSNNSITINNFRTGVFQGDLTGLYLNVMGADNTQIGSIALS